MSQNDAILSHLRKNPITPIEALQEYGCLRLAARILELKRDGHKIVKETVHQHEKTFARYRLIGD
jgi:hypothetical protein